MKKFALFLLMCVMFAVSVFADGMGYELKLDYDAANNGVTARLFVSEGDSVVAHIGYMYNTAKLQLTEYDYDSIPDVMPVGMDSNEYLNSIVKSSHNNVVITREYSNVDSLINPKDGFVMFGWYANLDVETIYAGTEIASFKFKLKDGVSYSSITEFDIAPVTKTQTAGVVGWSGGIMAANSTGAQYYYEAVSDQNKLNMNVTVVPYTGTLPADQDTETGTTDTPDTTVTDTPDTTVTDTTTPGDTGINAGPDISVVGENAYELKLGYDAANNGVNAWLYVSGGDSVVAHIGFMYNTSKLELVKLDYSSIPATFENTDVFLGSVIQSSHPNVHITREYANTSALINREKGCVLFGWYADLSVDTINAGTEIAAFRFKLKDGVSYSDITAFDVSPVSKMHTQDVTGWGNGIMAANGEGKYFFFEPADDTSNKLNVTVSVDPYTGTVVPPEVDSTTDTTDTTDATVVPGDNTDSATLGVTEIPVTESDTVKTADMAVEVKAFSDKIRIFWNKPVGFNVSEYRILVTDKDGQVVKQIDGITNITRSVTVKALAHDYEFIVSVIAVKPDGSLVYHNKMLIFKTSVSTSPAALIYSISYKAGAGTLYGMTSEQVLFGSNPTKAPTVYAPAGYEFAGWSVDGKNVADLSDLKIYSDTVLTAIYTKVQ